MKLSQWHDENVKPVHIGVYEIKRYENKRRNMFSFFDGTLWQGWITPRNFKRGDYPDKKSFIIYGQNRQWRGIIKEKK